MKRIRRHKYLLLSVFLLMYTVVHAVPVPDEDKTTVQKQIAGQTDNPESQSGKKPHEDATPDKTPDAIKPAETNPKGEGTNEKDEQSQEHISKNKEDTAKLTASDASGKGDDNPETKKETNEKSTETESPTKEEKSDQTKKTDGDTSKKPSNAEDENKKSETGKDVKTEKSSEPDKKEPTDKKTDKKETEKSSESDKKEPTDKKTDKKEKISEDKGEKTESKDQKSGTVKSKNGERGKEKTERSNEKGSRKDKEVKDVKIFDDPVILIHNYVKDLVVNTSLEKCTTPAIRQFPRPLMSMETRRHGGLILHILVAVYMFIGLAIVCDEYFVASLDRICEELKMSPDVAGATFMAAGSSAPELAIVIIGVFLAKDDIGISGVIGSAVFNIMFVIACCGLFSTAVVYLNWWPLVRDCFFYAVSIIVMLIVIYDERITWVESLVMLITYLIYCVVLHYNTPLERFAHTKFKHTAPTEQSSLVSYKTLDDEGSKVPNYGMEWSPDKQQPGNAEDGLRPLGMEWSPERHQPSFDSQLSGPALNQATTAPSPPSVAPAGIPPPRPSQQEYYKPKAYDPATQVDPLVRPEGGWYAQATWIMVYPIHYLCRKTTPDCRSEKYKNWYPLTFFISMVWISFYSYFMVWMITVIGFTLGIPDTVMGLTFVAAGVSVPDALSSIAVVREGYGDMAVSNAVGSNVFDILICLGLPWFLNTAIVKPGSTVKVTSKGLTYSTLSLLSTVVFLLVATHLNGWKLDKRYGWILLVWYLIFITLASLYELNIFAEWNPPECPLLW